MDRTFSNDIDMKKELTEVRGLILNNAKFTKQAIMEIRNMSFNLSEQIKGLDKQQKEFIHSMNLLLEACNQIYEEQNKVYTPKDMYRMFKVEGMTQAQIAKICGCSVTTVKRRLSEYKYSLVDMEV
jgi:DNA invertase Pin-like site-specific DNA recombinase